MTPAVIFEDIVPLAGGGGLNPLSPLADLRPVFDVRTGALTTLERLRRALGLRVVALVPRAEAARAPARAHPGTPADPPATPGDAPLLLINARCVLPLPEVRDLGAGEALVEAATGAVIAARAAGPAAAAICRGRTGGLRLKEYTGDALLSRPWDVVKFRDRAIAADLALLAAAAPGAPPPRCEVFGSHPLTIHPTARVDPGVVFDLEAGPIVIDAGAAVRPGAILQGPLYLGPGSAVLHRSLVKPNTAVGPHCRVAGEVGGAIIQGYSNKSHDGHLGDSWVGEWVNLGAGTTNSNLLNTYGEVKATALPGGPPERTGRQFLGAVVGDHVKAGICTRVMTGSVIHTGTMVAATPPVSGCVEPFRWVTDAGRRPYRLDKFLEAAKAMMSRRAFEPAAAYLDRVRELHAAAASVWG